MGVDKHASKRGKNIGGLLQLFDWNAKSRKKLFSTKSEFPEKSKQKKRCDGNLPMTRVHVDEYEYVGGGGSSVSCTSSVTDEDFLGTKAPGVVARLMGLDSLPRSNSLEPNSTTLFDCLSLPGSYCQSENLEYRRDYQVIHPKSMQDDDVLFRTTDAELKYHKVIMHNRPLEKFQIEILPPKSAKSIPITRNRLLSPIKSANVIRPENAAHIMEAAARIIEAGPQASAKTRLPLKVREFKEKVQTLQKLPSKVVSDRGHQRSGESSAAKQLRGQPMNKSWNSPGDAASLRIFPDADSVKGKGKSISLALQAKANVQKREALKETSEISPNQSRKNQSLPQKSMLRKASTQNNSSVLRLNNQKQNSSPVDKEKLPSKSKLQSGKVVNGDSSSTRQRNYSSKQPSTSKVSSRKLGSEAKDDKRQLLPIGSAERGASKKRSIDGDCEKKRAADSIRKDQNGKATHAGDSMDVPSSWVQENGTMESDVISFTFTAPITRSGPGSGRYNEADYHYMMLPNADSMNDSEHNLSTLLEQKLKELALKVELSKQKPETVPHVMVPGLNTLMNSIISEEGQSHAENYADSLEGQQSLGDFRGFMIGRKCQYTMNEISTGLSEGKMLVQCQLPGPISVLEHSPLGSSCSSSDITESNNNARCIKQCLPIQQFHDVFSEISDSASSTAAGTSSNRKLSQEMEYVKDILYDIEPMFMNYASGQVSDIISLHLFNQLESRKGYSNSWGVVSKTNRKVMFDCVSECMELRCREYARGGYKLWAKGIQVVKRKDKLAEDVCREICGWNAMGDFMVDELINSDMSSRYGRWLDFEVEVFEAAIKIESQIFTSLIGEVVADISVL